MSDSYEKHIQQRFDSYCKTVIRNEARNIYKEYQRFRERQIPLTEITEREFEELSYTDQSIENSEIFLMCGMEILVADLNLAEAIHHLPEDLRKVILLFYYAGFNDREISETIGMSTGSIWYRRKKAMELLRTELEKDG